jgi:hypothetical protein
MSPEEWEKERANVLKGLALLEQTVLALRKDVKEALGELKSAAAERQKQIDTLLLEHVARCVVVDNLVALMEKMETNIEKKADRVDVQALEKRIQAIEKLMPAVRIVMWVGALLGASIVALIWALITGRAQIVFL